MKKVKINYSTPYKNADDINGYVIAKMDEFGNLHISRNQEKTAIKKLTIGNVRPSYHTEKPIIIDD